MISHIIRRSKTIFLPKEQILYILRSLLYGYFIRINIANFKFLQCILFFP